MSECWACKGSMWDRDDVETCKTCRGLGSVARDALLGWALQGLLDAWEGYSRPRGHKADWERRPIHWSECAALRSVRDVSRKAPCDCGATELLDAVREAERVMGER